MLNGQCYRHRLLTIYLSRINPFGSYIDLYEATLRAPLNQSGLVHLSWESVVFARNIIGSAL
jgi:hypothetical protein